MTRAKGSRHVFPRTFTPSLIHCVPHRALEVAVDPTVRTLILRRFRSIPSDSVAFDNPTFFVGRNGSGKSNLVDAFDFLAEATVSPLPAVFEKRGGIALV